MTANQFRLLLASAAYVLIEHLRRETLHGTEFARAQVSTIRLKLFKIAARCARQRAENRTALLKWLPISTPPATNRRPPRPIVIKKTPETSNGGKEGTVRRTGDHQTKSADSNTTHDKTRPSWNS